MSAVDAITRDWIRNASDERAIANGCRFDEERGRFVVEWIERYCRLYEGEWAGQPMKLVDWQLECTMRLFGWVRWSDRWQREIRRFRQASIWLAKKNKKTPTAAAWALYLLCGDGEPGQKVFLAAKDGTQVRQNLAKHTVEMLLQSTDLLDECTLNRSTLQITHEATRSVLVTLSSSNSRTQQSKEGINGSLVIDETHVVDRDFMSRVSRAGISRSEPLHIEVSTAGNNPDGYGKERFDYAGRVETGETEDQELFVATYAAPQDLGDADLDADPVKWGRMANPAMGHTVDPEEYLKDYRTSKRSIHALLDFKMYRLNIWQHSANPWLKAGDWQACRRQYAEDDLADQPCFAALDLSRTRDMSSLVLAFAGTEPEEEFLLPYFWLPEDRAAAIESVVPDIRAWERAGHLFITSGGVTDYGHIKATFRRLAKLFRIQELAYDPKFAEEVTQSLEQGETNDAGDVIVEGTGVPRLMFKQDDTSFAGPTADFERLVISGKMHHNGNPLLSWQAGHATAIKRPGSGVVRVLKPTPGNVKTVDGVIGAIMATGRLRSGAAYRSGQFYEDHNVEMG